MLAARNAPGACLPMQKPEKMAHNSASLATLPTAVQQAAAMSAKKFALSGSCLRPQPVLAAAA